MKINNRKHNIHRFYVNKTEFGVKFKQNNVHT